jgi:Metallo-beta-lactamase superfamily
MYTDYEIDFLAVGEGERSGDAIAVRFGNLSTYPIQQTVLVIDGGTKQSGQKLVEHIRSHYGTNQVNAVISTHPDCDHISGLRVVLEELEVGQLAMHQPWNHATNIKSLFTRSITGAGLEKKIREELELAHELESIAMRKRIPIIEPFAGVSGFSGAVQILGPSQDYYKSLLPQFECTPQPKLDLRLFQLFAAAQQTPNQNLLGAMLTGKPAFNLGLPPILERFSFGFAL